MERGARLRAGRGRRSGGSEGHARGEGEREWDSNSAETSGRRLANFCECVPGDAEGAQ